MKTEYEINEKRVLNDGFNLERVKNIVISYRHITFQWMIDDSKKTIIGFSFDRNTGVLEISYLDNDMKNVDPSKNTLYQCDKAQKIEQKF